MALSDTAAHAPEEAPIARRIRAVGHQLTDSLRALVEVLPAGCRRPNSLAKEVGVNRAVASKVLQAVASPDPLEVVHLVPGPEPLRKVAAGAARRGVPSEIVSGLREAVGAFDALIRDEAGTRPVLDALLSSWLPEAREKLELSSKYAVYKGISQLKGARAQAWLGTAVIGPSADPLKADLTWLNGAVAMQRLRPGVAVRFSYRADAQATGDESPPVLLEDWCTNPAAQLVAERKGEVIQYVLPDDLLGPRAVTDMFVVDHHPAVMRRYAGEGTRTRSGLFVEPAMPVATLVFDVLLHDAIFPGATPGLLVYDTAHEGMANVNDPSRDIDRVDIRETVEVAAPTAQGLHVPEVPRYPQMLAHLAERHGWDLSRYRLFRTRIQYPVYGWQISLAFDRPEAPDGT